MPDLRAAIAAFCLALACAACAGGKGSSCQFNSDCTTAVCCLTCGAGPCQGNSLGICCVSACAADGGCPAGSSCDGGLCL